MFGTFEPEHEDEAVVYGIISPVSSFNQIWVQINYYLNSIIRFSQYKTLENKLKSLIMGPGWQPGTKRLGNPEDLPAIESPIRIYDVSVSTWKKVYAVAHFTMLIVFFNHAARQFEAWDSMTVWIVFCCNMISLGNIGSLLDDRKWIPIGELTRCAVISFLISSASECGVTGKAAVFMRLFFALSATFWTIILANKTFFQKKFKSK